MHNETEQRVRSVLMYAPIQEIFEYKTPDVTHHRESLPHFGYMFYIEHVILHVVWASSALR